MSYFGPTLFIFLICVILFFQRRWAVVAVTAGVFYLTSGQGFMIYGVNLFAFRIIELTALFRIIFRKDSQINKINILDKLFYLYNIFILVIFLFRCSLDISSRWMITYQIGIFVDASITYIVYRGLLKNIENINIYIKDIIYLLVPFSMFLIIESIKGINVFSYFTGLQITPYIRDGYTRCQASFGHAILAGSVGATLLPVFISIYFIEGNYLIGSIATIICLIIVFTSHSSGPLIALISGVIAWIFWPLRKKMRVVRWGIVGILLILQIIMKADIWFLPARISEIIGGDGWHRANLIDKWINSIGQWWLMGMSWNNTQYWAATKMPWGAVDATNEYVRMSINGGFISLLLYIYFIVKCYKRLGIKLKDARINGFKYNEVLCWGLGASLTSHIVNLTGVTYWDQFYAIWYMLLAIISGVTEIKTTTAQSAIPAKR